MNDNMRKISSVTNFIYLNSNPEFIITFLGYHYSKLKTLLLMTKRVEREVLVDQKKRVQILAAG